MAVRNAYAAAFKGVGKAAPSSPWTVDPMAASLALKLDRRERATQEARSPGSRASCSNSPVMGRVRGVLDNASAPGRRAVSVAAHPAKPDSCLRSGHAPRPSKSGSTSRGCAGFGACIGVNRLGTFAHRKMTPTRAGRSLLGARWGHRSDAVASLARPWQQGGKHIAASAPRGTSEPLRGSARKADASVIPAGAPARPSQLVTPQPGGHPRSLAAGARPVFSYVPAALG